MLASKNQREDVSEIIQKLSASGHRGFIELIGMLPKSDNQTTHQMLMEKLKPLTLSECNYIIKAYKNTDSRFHISTARNLIYRIIK